MNQNNIRNFCIIAHIDHGKSTLSDRLLEVTGTIDKRKLHDQFMDTLDLEQERGITIKLQSARMNYRYNDEEYVLNLIDTPGHVDFSYEVSRSLAACEGAFLLIDAAQGVEAQTISNAFKALEHDLVIIPVVNKIDLPNAEPERRAQEVCDMLGFKMEEVIYTSGKTGAGVEKMLDTAIEMIPAPSGYIDEKFQALIFDSFYDDHKGVVAQVRVTNGSLNSKAFVEKRKLRFIGTKNDIPALEIGYMTPVLVEGKELSVGEVGYIATGQKDIQKIRVGDTVTFADEPAQALPGYEKVNPMVFAGFYPTDSDKQVEFREALEKLALNDAALSYTPEASQALGFGFRCGFLGLLHMEIIQERLEREYGIDLVITAPSVEYRVKLQGNANHNEEFNPTDFDDSNLLIITSAAELPDMSYVEEIYEPWVAAEIILPSDYIGDIMTLCQEKRGVYKNTEYMHGTNTAMERVILKYDMPLSEIVTDFFDRMKSISHGYASLDYQFKAFEPGDIVKLNIMVHNEPVDALATLVDRDSAYAVGKKLVERLKNVIPKHQFKIPLQAAIGGKIIAREDIPAFKKDVLKGLYGGDHRRKMKHLERQKEGKKRMKQLGSVSIPQEAFLAVLKK
ncbi:MAG: translation elongation factor 4 [Candidatus Dojkabacteria bacterium]